MKRRKVEDAKLEEDLKGTLWAIPSRQRKSSAGTRRKKARREEKE